MGQAPHLAQGEGERQLSVEALQDLGALGGDGLHAGIPLIAKPTDHAEDEQRGAPQGAKTNVAILHGSLTAIIVESSSTAAPPV